MALPGECAGSGSFRHRLSARMKSRDDVAVGTQCVSAPKLACGGPEVASCRPEAPDPVCLGKKVPRPPLSPPRMHPSLGPTGRSLSRLQFRGSQLSLGFWVVGVFTGACVAPAETAMKFGDKAERVGRKSSRPPGPGGGFSCAWWWGAPALGSRGAPRSPALAVKASASQPRSRPSHPRILHGTCRAAMSPGLAGRDASGGVGAGCPAGVGASGAAPS